MNRFFIITSIAWLSGLCVSSLYASALFLLGSGLNNTPSFVLITVFVGLSIILQAGSLRRIRVSSFILPAVNLLAFGVMLILSSFVWGLGWDGQGKHQNTVTYLYEGMIPNNEESLNAFFGDYGVTRIFNTDFDERFEWLLHNKEGGRSYFDHFYSDGFYDNYMKRDQVRKDYYERHGEKYKALAYVRGNWPLDEYSIQSLGSVIYACIKGFTHDLESVKAYNLLLLCLAVMTMFSAIRALGLSTQAASWIAVLAGLNPISIIQIFTFSHDSQVASLTTLAIAWVTLIYAKPKRIYWVGFLISAFLLIATKMNGLIYALGLGVFLFLWFVLKSNYFKRIGWRKALFLVSTFSIVIMLAGYLVLAPRLLKQDKVGDIDWLYAKQRIAHYIYYDAGKLPHLKDKMPVERIFRSLVNQTTHGGVLQAKIPWTLHLREIKMYTKLYEGPELGGWGPFFSGCLLASLLVVVVSLRRRHQHKRFLLTLIGVITMLSLGMPSGYMARLNPVFWIVPLLALILAFMTLTTTKMRWLRILLLISAVLNIGHITACYAWGQIHIQVAYRKQLNEIARLQQPVDIAFNQYHSIERRFHDKGISFTPVKSIKDGELCIQMLRTPLNYGIHVRLDPQDPNAKKVYQNLIAIQESLHRKLIPLSLVTGVSQKL